VLEARKLIKPEWVEDEKWKIKQFGMGWWGKRGSHSKIWAPWASHKAYNKLFDKLQKAFASAEKRDFASLTNVWFVLKAETQIFAELMMIGRRVTQTLAFPTMSSERWDLRHRIKLNK
jgi:hypothetical protein